MVDVQFTYKAVVDGPVTIDITTDAPDDVRLYRNRVRLVNTTPTPGGVRWSGPLRKYDLIEVSSPTHVDAAVFPTGQESHV